MLPMSAIGRSHLGNPNSNKEKQVWVIRGKKTKARRNNRKRPSLIQSKNENRKEKRRKKCPVLSGHFENAALFGLGGRALNVRLYEPDDVKVA